MRHIACILAIILASCSPAEHKEPEAQQPTPEPTSDPAAGPVIPWPDDLPVYDHIVIVVEENKDWGDILGTEDAPYIRHTLASEGALFTKSFGLEHHSQGNYFWLFSGSNQGVGFLDEVPATCGGAPGFECTNNQPFDTSNVAYWLDKKGLSFKGYSESLPGIGSTVERTVYEDQPNRTLYARKHVPWISFSNIDNSTVPSSVNHPFESFPSGPDFSSLPTVSFVIPDLENDMHNVHVKPDGCDYIGSVCVGDTWLMENLEAYYRWAQVNNSLLIFTFDEDNTIVGDPGLTDPFHPIESGRDCKTFPRNPADQEDCGIQNNIVTIFAGAHIKSGAYDEGDGITHVNILRTIEAMYGLPRSGAQQENAVNATGSGTGGSIADDYIITDVFEKATTQPGTP